MNHPKQLPILKQLGLRSTWVRALALILVLVPQSQAVSTSQWQSFNLSTVNQYIIPGYQALSQESAQLLQATQSLCTKPEKPEQALQAARASFHDTMDAWQHIQNIQFGPVQTLMRNYSMQFWPDKKNHVGKDLAQLLSSNDPHALSDTEFHKASVSIKGLPAIERLLFEEPETKALQEKPFHCQTLIRIADYTANSAKASAAEWQQMKSEFAETGTEDSYFEDDIDAATTLLKTLVEPIEVIRDLKLLRPMGSEFGQQKSTRLESWRSERSLRNIRINLESLFQLYSGTATSENDQHKGLSALLDKQTDSAIRQQFSQIQKQLSEITQPLSQSIETEAGYKALTALADSLLGLHDLLGNAVAALDIHLGFNSRDGD